MTIGHFDGLTDLALEVFWKLVFEKVTAYVPG